MYALGPFLRKLSHLVNFNDLPFHNSLKSYFTKNTASKKWQDRRTIEIATELHVYAISKGKYNGHMQGNAPHSNGNMQGRCLTVMVTCSHFVPGVMGQLRVQNTGLDAELLQK